jgi:HPt (histidine-containing phosphotransfer) domain-containing protein
MDYSADAADRTFAPERREVFDRPDTLHRASAPALAPGEQVIDFDHLGRMTLGDSKLERDVLQLFDLQAGMLLERMTSEAPRVVAALAHTLVGSARGVGAWKVAEAAEMVERLADSRGPTTLTAAMNRLSSAVAEAQSAIGELVRQGA